MLSFLSSIIFDVEEDSPDLLTNILIFMVICMIIYYICICVRGSKRFRWHDACPCINYLGQTFFGEVPGFKLHVLVHKVKDLPLGPMSVAIKAANQSVSTNETKTNMWQQEVTVFVPQGCKKLRLSVINARSARKEGRAQIDVLRILRELDDEKGGLIAEHWLPLTSEGKAQGALQVSFSKNHFFADAAPLLEERGLNTEHISGPLGKLLSESAEVLRQDSKFGRPLTSEDEALRQKLRVLAGAISGPVQLTKQFGKDIDKYLKTHLDRNLQTGAKWCIGLWDNSHSVKRGDTPPDKVIPVLQITAVYPDAAKPHYFIIRYADVGGERRELILKRIDRERETWVEGLKLFIAELRAGIEQHKQRKASGKSRYSQHSSLEEEI